MNIRNLQIIIVVCVVMRVKKIVYKKKYIKKIRSDYRNTSIMTLFYFLY